MYKFVILPLMFFTFSTFAIGQETPIDKMFRVMSMDKQLEGGFEAMLPIIDQMSQKHQLDDKAKEELKGIFRDWFIEDVDQENVLNQLKSLYAQHFTNSEIIQITEFYETPVGKKFLNTSVGLMKLGAEIGMKEAQSKQIKLLERIAPFVEKHKIK